MLVGHDVELFVHTEKLISGRDFINLLQETDHQLSSFTLKQDNVMVEMNCDPFPAHTFFRTTRTQFRELNHVCALISEMGFQDSVHVLTEVSADASHLNTCPDFGEFNCDPAFNVWDGKPITPRLDLLQDQRTAGGHIHFETNNPEEIKVLDMILGVWEALYLRSALFLRKAVGYGMAGNCRVREHPDSGDYKYIAEYRTLSPQWMYDDAFGRDVQVVMTALRNLPGVMTLLLKQANLMEKKIQKAINEIHLPTIDEVILASLKAIPDCPGRSFRGDISPTIRGLQFLLEQ